MFRRRLMTRAYTEWSKADLIAHIKLLEGQSTPPTNKAPTSRPFDFSKYRQKYVAFKFAYLGWHYNGLVTQDMPTPLPTVEEVIFNAMLKTRLIESPESCRFSRCGRTDKGVSAVGQVMALNVRSASLVDGPEVDEMAWVNQLNGVLPASIRILAYAEVPDSFDARFSCVYRHYKYLLTPKIPGLQRLDLEAMQAACTYFLGTHDFRNFCKLDASKQITNFKRCIERCCITCEDGFYVLEIIGSAFLWHQVRCITAIVLLIGQGLEEPGLVKTLLDVEATPTKPVYEMADDWPLTLYDCNYGDQIKWIQAPMAQRIMESAYGTYHELRIKEKIASFMVDASRVEETMKTGLNLGTGKVKVQAKYVPIMQRPRLENIDVINAAWKKKKEKKSESLLAE